MIKIPYYMMIVLLTALVSCSTGPGEKLTLEKQWREYGDKQGQFKFPAMIASDKNSDIYIVDQHNHRIQKFDSEGNFILKWGERGEGPGQFNFPYGIATDSRGNVYVSDMNNNRIQKFKSDGEFVSTTGSYGTGRGEFKYPYGIAVDDIDILYVIDAFNYRIQKFNTDLEYISDWGNEESIGFRLYMPHEIAIAPDGNVILSDRQNHRISIFTGDGTLKRHIGRFGEGTGAEGVLLSEPHGVAADNSGNIFVCDRYNFRIINFTSGGEHISEWITAGTMDNGSHFPLGILISVDGSVFITDHYSHCVQKYK